MRNVLKIFFTILIFKTTVIYASEILSKNQLIIVKNQEIGEIFMNAEVTKYNNDFKLHGFIKKGDESNIYFSNEIRIEIAKIKKEFINNYIVLEEIQDQDGSKWKEIELIVNFKDTSGLFVQKTKKAWAEE